MTERRFEQYSKDRVDESCEREGIAIGRMKSLSLPTRSTRAKHQKHQLMDTAARCHKPRIKTPLDGKDLDRLIKKETQSR